MLMRLTTFTNRDVWVNVTHVVSMWVYHSDNANDQYIGMTALQLSDDGADSPLLIRETPDEILAKPVWQKLLAAPRR